MEFTQIEIRVKVKVAQPCPILCNPMDYRVQGILQARILEWDISFILRSFLKYKLELLVYHF